VPLYPSGLIFSPKLGCCNIFQGKPQKVQRSLMHLGDSVGNAGVLCCDRTTDQAAQEPWYLQCAISPAFVWLVFSNFKPLLWHCFEHPWTSMEVPLPGLCWPLEARRQKWVCLNLIEPVALILIPARSCYDEPEESSAITCSLRAVPEGLQLSALS